MVFFILLVFLFYRRFLAHRTLVRLSLVSDDFRSKSLRPKGSESFRIDFVAAFADFLYFSSLFAQF